MIPKVIKDIAKEIYGGWFIILSPFILLAALLTALFFLQNCSHDKISPVPARQAALVHVVNADNPRPKCKEKIKQIKSQRARIAKELDIRQEKYKKRKQRQRLKVSHRVPANPVYGKIPLRICIAHHFQNKHIWMFSINLFQISYHLV